MTNAIFIIPAEYQAEGNALGETMGWGPSNYSVALSSDGNLPATHYGCCAEVTKEFLILLQSPPKESEQILSVLILDIRETSDPFIHWKEIINENNLVLITDEI